MSGTRAPWWMFAVAAAYLGYVALMPYQAYWGPFGSLGFEPGFKGGSMFVLRVHPDTAASRARLEPQDRVLAVDRQIIRNVYDWQAIRANAEVGRPQTFEVSRGSARLQVTMTPERVSPSDKPVPLVYLSLVFISFALSLVLAFSRPYDPVARLGAWLLATASISLGLPDGWAVTWRRLPAVFSLLLWIPHISRFVVEAIVFAFFSTFPRRLFKAAWPWALIWGPVLLLLPWRLSAAYAVIYRPGNVTGAPEWVFRVTLIRTVVYLVGSLAALVATYRRLENLNERRRVRVLVTGAIVGFLSAIAYVVNESWQPIPELTGLFYVLLMLLLLAFPLSFAYAIMRHRLFDIHVMVRQGLQYALARGVLLSVVPALGVLLVVDLLLHGQQPLVEILESRGWVYGVLGVLALVAHARRGPWQAALDRRFFREHYDAQRLLREVVEEVRQAAGFERAAPRVVARIEAALHPEFVALVVREPREASFRTLAAAPSGNIPPPLPAGSKLLALIRVLDKPLEVSLTESGWLKQQLPHEETEFLRHARIDLLVPVVVSLERTEALLALGIKRSEEPYSQEDQNLLVAIADSLALLLEKPAVAVPARASEAFEECPRCGACYDTGAERCAADSASLVPVRLPRQLAGRYRLERRRGRGGMGAVYEATDTALERRVAVKVIRDDLVGSPEAAERFRREARAAASFAHPNVVTIHDFGVEAETRAFLVMELLEGTTLREELRQKRRLTASRALQILRGATAAVEAAHRRQLVHRDLKPENIFLVNSETGETAKVLDFGIAKFLPAAEQQTADTGTGALVGTVAYMAPEQLRGEAASPAWDLWALAVVAYEMLAGTHPFAGSNPGDLQGAVLAGRFTPVSVHLPEAPNAWQEFFSRALAPDANERPSTASDLLKELERALG